MARYSKQVSKHCLIINNLCFSVKKVLTFIVLKRIYCCIIKNISNELTRSASLEKYCKRK